MATTIVTKYGSDAPAASDIVRGELAVDTENGRLYTENSSAAVVELGSNPSGNITFGDNGKAIFGAGSDLQIYHDGNNSYIKDSGTGDLLIEGSDNIWLMKAGGSEVFLNTADDGAVTLYHNNAAKLATTATGIDVTGTATVDGLTVSGTAGTLATLDRTGSNGVYLALTDNSGSNVYLGNSGGQFQVQTAGASYSSKLTVESNGDISFYEDTGTTAKLFWDASAESLGIGTSSPTGSGLHVHNSTGGQQYISSSNSAMRFVSTGGINYIQSGTATSSSSAAPLVFTNVGGSGETMRIDSSGNLLVGKTATSLATAGIALMSNDQVRVTTASDNPLELNRLSNDGDIIRFYKDTAVVGSIGTTSETSYFTGKHAGILCNYYNASHSTFNPVTPTGVNRDGLDDLGYSASRFRDLYLSGTSNVGVGRFTAQNAAHSAASLVLGHEGSSKSQIRAYGINAGTIGSLEFMVSAADGTGSNSMTLNSSGSLLVGTTDSSPHDNSSGNGVAISASGGVDVAIADGETLYLNRMGSNGRTVNFRRAGAFVAGIDVTTTAVAYNTSSDQRLKENIADADDAGSKVDAIQVRKFDWKANGSHQDYGMIAQELIEVAPEAVSAPEDPDEMMGVDYSKLVPMLVKEIQQLRQRVAQLEE